MATMVYDSDLRTLNESELVYKISNRKMSNFTKKAPSRTLYNSLHQDAKKPLWRLSNSTHA